MNQFTGIQAMFTYKKFDRHKRWKLKNTEKPVQTRREI